MKRRKLAPGIFTIRAVLTADECQQVISFAEERGFDSAVIDSFGCVKRDEGTRNNDRVIDDEIDLARRLWNRVEKFVPPMLDDDRPVRGLNERFRYYRYAPGQGFPWHLDGHFRRPNGEESFLTFMIYLNEGYKGGKTQFQTVSVASKQGMALVFKHKLFHQDFEVTRGVKYVLCSDVMYGPSAKETRRPAWCEAPMSDVASSWLRCDDYYLALWRMQSTDYRCGRAKGVLWSMRELVERTAPLAIAENIYAWTAHWHAWLMLWNGDPARAARKVYLWCARHGSRVAISWYKDGRPVLYTVEAMDSARWQRLVNWLNMTKTDA